MNQDSLDPFSRIDHRRGSRLKRVIDAARTSQRFYTTLDVHRELLNHYEAVDWFERDSEFDFVPYMQKWKKP